MLKYSIITIFFLFSSTAYYAQTNPWISTKDDFSWSLSSQIMRVPYGYTGFASLKLDKNLEVGKKYEVTILVEGRIPKSLNGVYEAAKYDFWIFESGSYGDILKNNNTVSSNTIFATLRINGRNNSARSFFKFTVQPKEEASHLTVALKNDPNVRNPEQYVTLQNCIVLELPPDKETVVSNVITDKINSRKSTALSDKITVDQEKISIVVYDHRRIDNDIISLYLNNIPLVEDLPLARKKKKIEVSLQPGENALLLFAENLGEVPPNTAAIEIVTKKETIQKILASDLKESEYLIIDYKPDNQ